MNNHKYILTTILLILVVGAIIFLFWKKDDNAQHIRNTPPTVIPTTIIPAGWKTIESKSKGFKISYPADFIASETASIMISTPNNIKDVTVVANCNEELPGDTLSYTVKQIIFKNLPATEYTRTATLTTAATRKIRFTKDSSCFTITSFSHSFADPSVEDLNPIIDTFEFTN